MADATQHLNGIISVDRKCTVDISRKNSWYFLRRVLKDVEITQIVSLYV